MQGDPVEAEEAGGGGRGEEAEGRPGAGRGRVQQEGLRGPRAARRRGGGQVRCGILVFADFGYFGRQLLNL